jgi:AAHS family 4-hydroxybenzoate transporter-like MFS transporter
MMTGAGLALSVATNGLAAFNLGGVGGAIVGGLVIARAGSRLTMLSMTAAAIATTVALAMLPLNPSTSHFAIIALLGVAGALINGVQTTMYALAAHVYPTAIRATGVGTAVAIGRSGGVLSSYVGAWALEAGGSAAFFGSIAGALVVAFCSLAVVRKHVPVAR